MGENRGNFSGKVGFVLAAAGSAVGLGNIWRFPYLAAKDHGGVFILVYIILALSFGFTLLTTEIAIGRKTGQGPLTAYGILHKGWNGIGILAWLVPVIILPYYCTIGGWVFKYFTVYLTGAGKSAVADTFFTGFITSDYAPMVFGIIYLLVTALVVFLGVDNGIERISKILMPVLLILIIGISIYSVTLSHTADDGTVRTGLEGLRMYVIPDFSGISFKQFCMIVIDAMGQLFFSISVAMGIMVTYGSYVKKDVNLMASINQIEIFDTVVAMLAGMMIVPAVYVFMGQEGMSGGPGLMFVSLPKVFNAMGSVGYVIGLLFFLMTLFAAVTSSVSVMEAIVSGIMDKFRFSRKKSTVICLAYAIITLIVVCLGYNKLYFEIKLPTGSTGQILDVMDFLSNNIFMPLVALFTCIFIGWVVKPKTIIDEVTNGGQIKFRRKGLYIAMIKVVAPILLFLLLLQSFGVF